ncbi:MAG: PepSY-like domain-containing protein [Bacteroidota bacterium]
MKKYILILLCIVLPVISLNAQKIADNKVPAPVMKSFKDKYPKMAHADWNMESNGDYAVQFTAAGIQTKMTFEKNGTWIETEKSIPVASIPASPKATLDKEYAEYTIESADKINSAKNGESYSAKVKKGDTSYLVKLDAKGTILSKSTDEKTAHK